MRNRSQLIGWLWIGAITVALSTVVIMLGGCASAPKSNTDGLDHASRTTSRLDGRVTDLGTVLGRLNKYVGTGGRELLASAGDILHAAGGDVAELSTSLTKAYEDNQKLAKDRDTQKTRADTVEGGWGFKTQQAVAKAWRAVKFFVFTALGILLAVAALSRLHLPGMAGTAISASWGFIKWIGNRLRSRGPDVGGILP